MGFKKPLILEVKILVWMSLILGFLAIAFRENIGISYVYLVIVDVIVLVFIKRKLFMNKVAKNTFTSFLYGLGAYFLLFVFYYISSFLMQGIGVNVASPSLGQMISYMKTQSLVLSTSKILDFIAVVIVAVTIETKVFFGSVFDFILDTTKTSIDKFSAQLWAIIIFISGVFTWYHVQVRGQSNVAWFITFIFAILSCILVVKRREIESAWWLHFINNLITKIKGG